MGSYQIFGLILVAIIAFAVGADAKKRGMNGALWGVGTFLLCIVFLPLYFIVRKPIGGVRPRPGTLPPCPHCGKSHEGDLRLCPFCGAPQP